jgi:nicotinamide phosphoribosyltransferase
MTQLNLSLLHDTDSYKYSQWLQYPPNTTAMYSYFESRGGRFKNTLFFGLQYYLKRYLSTPITMNDVEEVKTMVEAHGEPFNYEGFKYIVEKHNGYWPVRIKAVPEGTILPYSNILMSIESTDPNAFWVVNFLETAFVRLWYPITIATYSYEAKQVIQNYLNDTCDNPENEIGFKLHDFGSRGCTSQEQAAIGGASHLLNFLGTDTTAALWLLNRYYNADVTGFSIPASEHSTMTSWGNENEVKAFDNMIKQFGDGAIFACVSDSYDIYNAVENLWGDKLKQKVQDMNAMLVVRPDSGDAVQVPVDCVIKLAEKFGYTTNKKGYKVLNNVRVIQGDGINIFDVEKILEKIKALGFSTENMAFGMGAGLLQKDFNRDTNKFAFKCSWIKCEGKDIDVFKQPITDKVKISKKGKQDLIEVNGEVATVPGENHDDSILEVVYENGKILKEYTLEEIRARVLEGPKGTYKGWSDKKI